MLLSCLSVARADEYQLFARTNLMAWCIVPFDAKKRGPEERAAMMEQLGFKHFAYDYRAEHIPQFDAELAACKKHGVSLDAWWFPTSMNEEARLILEELRRNKVRAQLWVMGGGNPTKTAEVLDADGWLHSGDIGQFDADGYLRVVDRKKELIITAGGKNVSPANLESALKAQPLIGQACVIGDQRPFMSALVVLDSEVAPVWAKAHGIEATALADLADEPEVRAEVDREVAEAMHAFNNAEAVKKVSVLHEEWMPDSEELTPTSKLKRRGIHAKYAKEINALYGG